MLDAAAMAEIPWLVSQSFDQIVSGHQTQLLRTAYRMAGNWADAEDVAQEVFVRLHRHGLRFPNEGALRGWLYRVTVNLCLDRARAAQPWEELAEVPSRADSAEALAIRDEQKRRLMAALSRLAPKERAAVVLREIEGLSTQEVASILGSTEGTVRSQVAKAIGRLRALLTEEAR
jgi:RNA polymerase sigma-70 factor (ECF subfamily)